MKAPVFLLALAQISAAAEEPAILATSDWSKPVANADGHSLRVRMIVAQGRGAAFAGPLPETQFYLEFQNVSADVSAALQFYFDPSAGLRCVLQDANGKSAPQAGGGSGGGPAAAWVTLPYDSTLRLRANFYGYGKKPGDGLLLYLWPPAQAWSIRAGDPGVYYLSGTFIVSAPARDVPQDAAKSRAVWSGTLELPRMKISLPKP